MKVCIGVCTARRRKMLADCLASLGAQRVPDDVSVSIVVVDNEAQPNNRAVVEAFAATCPFPVIYSHQPDPGIPQARNRALDEAARLDPDWIAFIDDDEAAEPDWLAQLLSAAKRYQADVARGEVRQVFLDETPWVKPRVKSTRRADGETVETAATCNVLFRGEYAAHRFDERRRFSGNTDTIFFRELAAKGAKIVVSRAAIVTEFMPPDRCTYGYQIRQTLRREAFRTAAAVKQKGWIRTALYAAPRAGRIAFEGLIYLAFAVAFFLPARRRSHAALLNGGKKLMAARGIVDALLSIQYKPYRQHRAE